MLFLTVLAVFPLMGEAGVRESAAERGVQAVKEQDWMQAASSYRKVLNFYNAGKQDKAMCHDFLYGGNSCSMANRYVEALEFYRAGIAICRRFHGSKHVPNFQNNIGNIFGIFEDYPRACHYFHEAFEESRRQGNRMLMATSLVNLTNAYVLLQKPDSAHKYLSAQLDAGNFNSPEKAYFDLYNQGTVALLDKNTAAAVYYLKGALRTAEQKHLDVSHCLGTLSMMGKAWAEAGNVDSAENCYRRMIAIADTGKQQRQLLDAYRFMEKLYRDHGRTDSADYYSALYEKLDSAVFDTQTFNQRKQEIFSDDENLNKERISGLTRIIRQGKMIIICILSVLLVAAVFLIIVYRLNRRLRISHKILIGHNTELLREREENIALRRKYLQTLEQQSKEDAEQKEYENKVPTTLLSDEKREEILHRFFELTRDASVLADSTLTATTLAKEAGTNAKYLALAIKQTYGKTFKEFINELRVNEVCRRLADTENYGNLTLQAIAESCGYNSYTNFTTAFRKSKGMSPAEYRKITRQQE